MTVPADLRDRVGAELVRLRYRQMRRSVLASVLVVLFVAQIARMDSPGSWALIWMAVYAANYASVEVLIRLFERARPDDAGIRPWRIAAAVELALSGLIWGVGFTLFISPDQPLTIGLLICAMAAVTAGGIGFCSTILAGFHAFTLLATLPMAARFFLANGAVFDLLGVSMLVYAAVIMGYGRAQHMLIAESLAMRFRNDALVDALRDETAAANAARRDAEQASLAKSQFLAAASHDLRQPLYALSLFSGSLGEMPLGPGPRAIVRDIQDSITAMEELFAGLLDISRLDAGVVEPQLVAVSVEALFDRLSQYFRPIALERGLDLRFRSDGEWVRGDPVLLEQVLGNLVSNALRWTRRGGVLVAARPRKGAVRLEVWDTGIGIADEDRLRIFDDFVQLENPERDRGKGLGLGLAIARRSAALLGTGIALASRPGVGSRFGIVQPVAVRPASLPAAGQRVLPDAWRIARDPALPVLVIDDDRDIRAALGKLLRQWGVAADLVPAAEAALAVIRLGRRYGLVLCDYRLGPDGTGLDLIAAIRAAHPSPAPPCVLVTGDFGTDVVAGAHAAAVPLLYKPVRADDLAKLLGLPETGPERLERAGPKRANM